MYRLLFILGALAPALASAQPTPLILDSEQISAAWDAYASCFKAAGKRMILNRIDPASVLAAAAAEMCEEQQDDLRRAVHAENLPALEARDFAVTRALQARQLLTEKLTIAIAKARAMHPR